MDERKRDFLRCARAKVGIMVCVDGDVNPLFLEDIKEKDNDLAFDAAWKILNEWLVKQKIKVEKSTLVPLLSVTPGFEFLMKQGIPPTTRQDRYIVIAGPNQLRVLWVCFATDTPKPNEIAGPYVINLLSENLLEKDSNSEKTRYIYSIQSNKEKDIVNVLSKKQTALAQIGTGSESALTSSLSRK